MKIVKLYFFMSVFLCPFANAGGFSSAQEQKSDTPPNIRHLEPSASQGNLIHSGDVIDVDVIGSVEYDWRGTLTPEGNLNGINYIENPIFALCRTENEVADDIAMAYGKFLREPRVEVKIVDRSNRPFSILYGAVKMPQRFQIKRAVHLNELLIAAGGITDKASGEIQIFRPENVVCPAERFVKISTDTDGTFKRERIVATGKDVDSQYKTIKISDLLAGEKEANPQVFAGDVITVNEAESVYVIGGVVVPKRLFLRSEITLSRAIDSAGGLTKSANAKKVIISRRTDAERKTIEINLEKIRKNETEDIVLQASDIIEVTQKKRGREKAQIEIKDTTAEAGKSSSLPLRVID